MEKQHNGWTNNATWRIVNDVLGNIDFEQHTSADELKEIVEDVVFSNVHDDRMLCVDFAKAFIRQVNFYEIARLINEEIDLQTEHDND